METKKCNICKIEKTLDNFYYRKNRDIYENTCTPCVSASVKEKRKDPTFYKKNKEACKKYHNKNKEKMNENSRKYYEENKDKLKANMNKYYQDNREMSLENAKEYRNNIKEKIRQGDFEKPDIQSKVCNECKEEKEIIKFTYRRTRNVYDSKCKDCNKIREANRRKGNGPKINARRREIQKPLTVEIRIVSSLRKRLNGIVKSRKGKNMYLNLLGCSKEFLFKWFEYIFSLDKHLGMNWSNYGTIWQIDHITPCASFNLLDPNEQKKCFHWTNLCPVLKPYNLSKQAKIISTDQIKQNVRVNDFEKLQNI